MAPVAVAAITATLAATAAARSTGLAIGLVCMTSSRRRGRSPAPAYLQVSALGQSIGPRMRTIAYALVTDRRSREQSRARVGSQDRGNEKVGDRGGEPFRVLLGDAF